MINKKDLKGRCVEYIDKDGATRICKVYRISGNTLTVGHIITLNKNRRYRLRWERIHPDKNRIMGVYHRKKKEEIDWGRRKNDDF